MRGFAGDPQAAHPPPPSPLKHRLNAGGFIVDYFGRRDAIVGNAVGSMGTRAVGALASSRVPMAGNQVIFFAGAALLTAAPNLEVLLLGRVVVGFAVSLSAVAEASHCTTWLAGQARTLPRLLPQPSRHAGDIHQ